ncbi:MAG: hypothetical protein KDI13_06810 [Alphaproteobacteria bacterium]|nr:hypothetical protein [Alphaproteobacteria bacterium]
MSAIMFNVIALTGIADLQSNPDFAEWYLIRIMITWLVCALFSVSIFFLSKSKWKYFFAAAPIIFPCIGGFVLLAYA